MNQNKNETEQRFLEASELLGFFLNQNEELDTAITCGSEQQLMTSDYELYQALGSLKSYDVLDKSKLVKMLEVVDVVSHRLNNGPKKVLTHEHVEKLRGITLGGTNE